MIDGSGQDSGIVRLLASQVRYHNRLYWRSHVATFFTMVLPVFLLVMLVTVLGDTPTMIIGMPASQFYAPSLAVFGAASACYMYLPISLAMQKEHGVLKRIYSTPLPPWIFFAGKMLSTAWLAAIAALVIMAVGVLAYDVAVFVERLPAALLVMAAGIVTFSALGTALGALVTRGETAQAISNATLLPLAFVSDIFMLPFGNMPRWLQGVADIFPLRHFAVGFARAFDPHYVGSGFERTGGANDYFILPHLAVLLLWAAIGIVVTLAFFDWGKGEKAWRPGRWLRGK